MLHGFALNVVLYVAMYAVHVTHCGYVLYVAMYAVHVTHCGYVLYVAMYSMWLCTKLGYTLNVAMQYKICAVIAQLSLGEGITTGMDFPVTIPYCTTATVVLTLAHWAIFVTPNCITSCLFKHHH